MCTEAENPNVCEKRMSWKIVHLFWMHATLLKYIVLFFYNYRQFSFGEEEEKKWIWLQ